MQYRLKDAVKEFLSACTGHPRPLLQVLLYSVLPMKSENQLIKSLIQALGLNVYEFHFTGKASTSKARVQYMLQKKILH